MFLSLSLLQVLALTGKTHHQTKLSLESHHPANSYHHARNLQLGKSVATKVVKWVWWSRSREKSRCEDGTTSKHSRAPRSYGELFWRRSGESLFPKTHLRHWFCHSRGAYHRDLKPENLLLDEEGNLKVTNFSLNSFTEHLKQDGLHRLMWRRRWLERKAMTVRLLSGWFKSDGCGSRTCGWYGFVRRWVLPVRER